MKFGDVVTFKENVCFYGGEGLAANMVPNGMIGVVYQDSNYPWVIIGEGNQPNRPDWNEQCFMNSELIKIGVDKKLARQLERK